MLTKIREANYFLFELFIFTRLVSLMVSNLAINMLIQDKICTVTYRQEMHFCQNIHLEMNTTQEEVMKDRVLGETATFANYKNIMEAVPMVIWALFVGSFLDNYSGASIVVLFLNIFGSVFSIIVYMFLVHFYDSSPYLMLIGSISMYFTGGLVSLKTTAFRYITINTDESMRAIKFVILQVLFVAGLSSSIYLGGQLLSVTQKGPQLRTYFTNFSISFLTDVISFVMLLILVRIENIRQNNTFVISGDNFNAKKQIEEIPSNEKTANKRHFLQILFDVDNVRQTFVFLFKSREGHIRLQIYLLYFLVFNEALTNTGKESVILQFAQKVYHWSSTQYTTFKAVYEVLSTFILAIGSVIFVKCLKFEMESLIVIAILSTFLHELLIGTILSPVVYMVALPIGCFSGFAGIALRTKQSKLVSKQEVGKLFSLSSVIEAMVPIFSTLIYTNIFSATIGSFPGIVFQFSSFIMLISLLIMTFEVYFCVQKKGDLELGKEIEL